MKDYYSILGVTPDTSIQDINKAYKKLVFKYHPDRNQNNIEEANSLMAEINEAYSILSNEETKQKYDQDFFRQNSSTSWSSTNTTNNSNNNIKYIFKLKNQGNNTILALFGDTYQIHKTYYVVEDLNNTTLEKVNEYLSTSPLTYNELDTYIWNINKSLDENNKLRYYQLAYNQKEVYIENWRKEKVYVFPKNNPYSFHLFSKDDILTINNPKLRDIEEFEELLKAINYKAVWRYRKMKKDLNLLTIIVLLFLGLGWLSTYIYIVSKEPRIFGLLFIPVLALLFNYWTVKRYFKKKY